MSSRAIAENLKYDSFGVAEPAYRPRHFRPSFDTSSELWPEKLRDTIGQKTVWPVAIKSASGVGLWSAINDLYASVEEPDYEKTYGLDAWLQRTNNYSPRALNIESLPYSQKTWPWGKKLEWGKAVPTAVAIVGAIGVLASIQATSGDGAISVNSQAASITLQDEKNDLRVVDSAASRGGAGATATTTIDAVGTPTIESTTSTAPPETTTTLPITTTTKAPIPTTAPKKKVAVNPSMCSNSRAAAMACWGDLIGKYSWNKAQAFNIMWCESKGNPNAKNPRSTARGLFQILNGPLDPEANVKLAYEMYSKRGWQPWVCKP